MAAENADERFEKEQLALAQQKGIIAQGEKVLACVSLFNYSQMIFLLMPLFLLPRFILKKFLLVVTDRRVLLVRVPAFAVHGTGYHQWVECQTPCPLKLERPAKEFHQTGNKVVLPTAFASFVGRPFGFVLRGRAAEKAFQLASQASHLQQQAPHS
jgi:hypothetical protein